VLTHATIPEIANAEKINESYVGRVLRLTLLAPDIVEAILGGRQPAEVTLAGLCRGVDGAAEDIERSIVHVHLVGVAGESLRLKA